MRTGLTYLALALLLIGACAEESAPPVALEAKPPLELSASVDKATATTGDVITYSVTLNYDEGVEVEYTEPGADIAGLRVIDIGSEPAALRDGRKTIVRWYKLRADLVGSYILPPLRVRYLVKNSAAVDAAPKDETQAPVEETTDDPQAAADENENPRADGAPDLEDESADAPRKLPEFLEATTSEIFIEVKSVLQEGDELGDIRDIKPIKVLPKTPYWLYGAIAGFCALVFGALGWWWHARRKEEVLLPEIPPHEIAFAALDALRRTDFADAAAARKYFFQISQVVRAYIEGRFSLNATDLTTEEILSNLKTLNDSVKTQEDTLRQFLDATDRVKFADHKPTSEDIEAVYEWALGFVERTVPRPEPHDADSQGNNPNGDPEKSADNGDEAAA